MTADSTTQVAVVLVGEEDLFLDLLQRFPARRYPVVFANDLKEASDRFKLYQPQVLVVPVGPGIDVPATIEVLGTARRRETKVIGLGEVAEIPPDVAELLDEVTAAGDVNALLEVVALALRERRVAPRATLDVPLTISGLGDVRATVISGRSLFVPTETPLKSGRMAQIEVDAASTRLRCWARVVRVGAGEGGQGGMVLGIGEREHAVRAFLDGLVRGALLLERAEVQGQDPISELPDSVSNRLEERVQQEVATLRARLESQVALTEALGTRLDSLAQPEAGAVQWKDVRPVLVKKWSAQRDVIKTIIERVNKLTASQEAATKLQGALETEADLHTKLAEQEAVVETLRARIDEIADGPGATAGQQAQDSPASVALSEAQGRLEAMLSDQGRLIESLAERLELLASRGLPAREINKAHKTLDDHAAQIASLALRLDDVRDQLRIGADDTQQISRMQERLDGDQHDLEQLPDPLGSLEIGQWASMPQLSAVDGRDEILDASADAQTVNAPAPDEPDAALETPLLEHTPSSVGLRVPANVPSAFPPVGPPLEPSPEPPTEACEPLASPRLGPLARMPKWLYLVAPIAGTLLGLGIFGTLRATGVIGGPSGPVVAKPAQHNSIGVGGHAVVAADAGSDSPGRREPAPAQSADAGHVAQARDASATVADAAPGASPLVDASARSLEQPKKRRSRRSKRISAAARRRAKRKREMKLGSRLLAQRRYKESRRHLTAALKLKDDHRVRRQLARSHQMVGEFWAAAHHLKRCIALSPRRLRPRRHDDLGKIYAKLGKKSEACQNFRAALRLQPYFKRAQAHTDQYCSR